MKMPFFASIIIFVIWLSFTLSRSRSRAETKDDNFWDKETEANNTRRKSLDDLEYITIPFDTLPMHIMEDDDTIKEYHEMLHSLTDSPIVNFTGITNTDLKLKYGAPNITLLTRYDQSYTTLASVLQRWADRIYAAGYIEETLAILEFAISTNTDVSGSYRLLASIYDSQNHPEKIADLLERAEHLNSRSKNAIVRILQEYDL